MISSNSRTLNHQILHLYINNTSISIVIQHFNLKTMTLNWNRHALLKWKNILESLEVSEILVYTIVSPYKLYVYH